MKKTLLGLALAGVVAGAGTYLWLRGDRASALSVGRGWPVSVMKADQVGSIPVLSRDLLATAVEGKVPAGIHPLARDLFTTKDFRKDMDLWADPRYFRCNSPASLEAMWGGGGAEAGKPPDGAGIGSAAPGSASWGHCERDYPRESIVSPYPFKSAQEHYEALLAETRRKGGPRIYTRRDPPPDWNGRYTRPVALDQVERREGRSYKLPPAAEIVEPPQWFFMPYNQTSTILSLLTPEYRRRAVQMHFHQAVSNAHHWPGTYCWPEGLLRVYSQQAHTRMDISVSHDRVQFLASSAENFVRHVNIGRTFDMTGAVPRLGADVPRWYGDTVGFWDDEVLITWTSNVIPWIAHGIFEYSPKMQTVEILSAHRGTSGQFVGIDHEIILYDPLALAQPVRMVQLHVRTGEFGSLPAHAFTRCLQTIFPIDGRPQPRSPGARIEYMVPDMYGRPWAKLWEQFFERDMERSSDEEELFKF